MARHMHNFNVPDLGPRQCPCANSRTQIMADLREFGLGSSAGDSGSLMIWRREDGTLHGERHAWCVTQSEIDCKKMATLREWVWAEWDALGRHDRLAGSSQ